MKITIIDYGVGNIFSIKNAFSRVDIAVEISNDIEEIESSDVLILPGVGAFKDAMESLKNSGAIPSIMKHAALNKPLLGICLGMQLLYTESEEFGITKGLGILNGSVKKIPTNMKLPHMGWNDLTFQKATKLNTFLDSDAYVYFVHSYYVDSKGSEVVATTNYDIDVPAIVVSNNVVGMQFHPEKSGVVGEKLIKAYGEMIYEYISSNRSL